MYVPSSFEENRVEVLHELIRARPFATLVVNTEDGLDATHIPFELVPDAETPFGTLRGHVARANPIWRSASRETTALVIFQGPSCYVTPSWYASKQEHGRVVPTWNYTVVHAHGPLRSIDDPVWLRGLVERLTDRHEAGRMEPWKVTDAPPSHVQQMLRAIVGLEIRVARLVGKWKWSQNRDAKDREGVALGLLDQGSEAAAEMAALVRAPKSE
jgi:transcriptional regulator